MAPEVTGHVSPDRNAAPTSVAHDRPECTAMGTMHRLFVYGTLRHPPLLAGLVGRPIDATPATLPGHRAAVLRHRPYPGLVVDAASSAVGSLIEVDDEGLAVLDRFEGPEYTRTRVTVQVVTHADATHADATHADGTVAADAYLLTGPTRSFVESAVWSLDDFVAGDAGDWVRGAVPGTHHPQPDPDEAT